MNQIETYTEGDSHLTLVKQRGRWYYVGNTAETDQALVETADRIGVQLIRREGPPVSLANVYSKHGVDHQAVKNAFPRWRVKMGLE